MTFHFFLQKCNGLLVKLLQGEDVIWLGAPCMDKEVFSALLAFNGDKELGCLIKKKDLVWMVSPWFLAL